MLFGCRGYKDFDEVILTPTPPATPEPIDTQIQLLASSLTGENSAYWQQHDHQVYIYPHAWQDLTLGHTLQLDQSQTIIHSAFTWAELDTIAFDPENPMPHVLLKGQATYQSPTTLDIYQLHNGYPDLLFRTSTPGEISYLLDEANPSNSSILITTSNQDRLQVDYYQYNRASQQFLLTKSESTLQQLTTNRDRLEAFLEGPWQSDPPEAKGLVVFNAKEKEILFQQGRVEIYDWLNSSISGNRITLQARNQQVAQVSGNSNITIIDDNTIILTQPTPSVAWQGRYTRINLQQELVNSQAFTPITLSESPFSGTFTHQNGEALLFNYPLFQQKNAKGVVREGSMSLFRLENTLIMQLRYRNVYGLIEEQQSFEVVFKEENDGLHRLRLLQLKPTRLFVAGSYPLVESTVEQFEQIEKIP